MVTSGWSGLAWLMLFWRCGSCDPVASGQFSGTVTVSELTWGLRSASASCDLTFPTITMNAGSTFIFTRFNVRVLDFTHYVSSSPTAVQMGSSSKWLVVGPDYDYFGVLNYGFHFTYGEFLGTDTPTGDCAVFTNLTEALAYGDAASELTVTETDRFVSNDSFLTVAVEGESDYWRTIVVTCQLPLGSFLLGLYEIYVYINLGMPVYNIYSLYSTAIIKGENGSSWYLGRFPNYGNGFIIDSFRFTVPRSSSPVYNNGFCSVYALTNETLPSIISSLDTSTTSTAVPPTTTTTVPLTTSTTVSTTTTTTVPLTTSTSALITSTTANALPTTTSVASTDVTLTRPPAPITTSSTVSTQSAGTTSSVSALSTTVPLTLTIVENFSESGQRRMIRESSLMRNQMVSGQPERWSAEGSNPLQCGRQCLKDTDCLSFFFLSDTQRCLAHSNVFSGGDSQLMYTAYYVIE